MAETLPLLALPAGVERAVGLVCIVMAGVVLVLAMRRRESGYDLMLIASAAVVILLAIAIMVYR